ncbi:hypothetical protein JM18_009763 [Phytophthora kernoviae]|uniref:Alpha-carbonic anhydrase domain-containing protein n=1 Tax=Phytophthora kernoviae TaxID=325452 RepID=A0A921V3L5_9STRA|nr:hypothetical protein JM18_009763 [Phytophthora kernoviae]
MGGAPWGYKTSDATMASPEQWADHYPTCAGSRQSPIDITTTTSGSVAARSLAFSGECDSYSLTQPDESSKASITIHVATDRGDTSDCDGAGCDDGGGDGNEIHL